MALNELPAIAGDVLPAAAVAGELLPAPGSLMAAGREVIGDQAGPLTQQTYALSLGKFVRHLTAQLGREPQVDDLTRPALQGFRDAQQRAGRAPATIAKDLSALRGIAAGLELDARIAQVKAPTARRGQPRPLSRGQLDALLRAPDGRTRIGRRDRAILHLMAFGGLRRAEVTAAELSDVEAYERHDLPARRRAFAATRATQTRFRLHVRGKGNRARAIDLHADALDALRAWLKVRPAAETDHLFLSARGAPRPLAPRAINRIVDQHADAALLPDDRRTPHILRHTFCTLLAQAGEDLAVIQDAAGHADPRTTRIYAQLAEHRVGRAIDHAFDRPTATEALTASPDD